VRPEGTVVAARGLEIDLGRSLAARLGVKRVRFVNEPSFARLLARGSKPWNVALAEVTITAGRKQNVDLSESPPSGRPRRTATGRSQASRALESAKGSCCRTAQR
jgi:Bacterial extracellular solute-binding proteins, family 3